MQNRIKAVRKYYKLTQKSFGEKVGVKGNTVTNYETGLRVPSEAVIKSICREYGVDEDWLRTGEGLMFRDTSQSEMLDKAIQDVYTSNDSLIKGILIAYSELSDEKRAVIREIVEKAVKHSRQFEEEEEK